MYVNFLINMLSLQIKFSKVTKHVNFYGKTTVQYTAKSL